ncbi:MAG: hypothetical protein HW421_3639 [Ignavibacteria bacterium]|nr:hypothetical protein [Ignavibacteria bacterium]
MKYFLLTLLILSLLISYSYSQQKEEPQIIRPVFTVNNGAELISTYSQKELLTIGKYSLNLILQFPDSRKTSIVSTGLTAKEMTDH